VAKLVEYQRFKQAAKFLEGRADSVKDVFYRGAPRFEASEKTLSLSFFDLMGALREVLDRAEDKGSIVAARNSPSRRRSRRSSSC